ncbi:MAG: hypothetical protein RL026_1767 [Pseudomonadota bacterium]
MKTSQRNLSRATALAIVLASGAIAAQAGELPNTVKSTASAGLITLATTGNPNDLQKELGGEVVKNEVLISKVGAENLNKLLDTAKEEHLAPMTLVAPTGEMYNMVAPTITKDNFILVDKDGMAHRFDVGATEGTNMPFEVKEIAEDGGTPWYVELWYWFTGLFG